MKAEDFVRQLVAIAPDIHVLLKECLDRAEVEETVRRYRPLPLKKMTPESGDPLVDLLNNYDVSAMSIGIVSFLKRVRHREQGRIVGELDDLEPVVLDGESKEVRVEESESDGARTCPSAADGGRFLDALLIAARYFVEQAFDVGGLLPGRERVAAARECAKAVGGGRYLTFYSYMLGC